jgi:hypothetical protein
MRDLPEAPAARQEVVFRREAGDASQVRQGDIFPDVCVHLLWERDGDPISHAAGHGSVVVSQTCDVVRTETATVQFAPLVVLTGQDARLAGAGRRPRFVPVPGAGGGYFADLDYVSTVRKESIDGLRGYRGLVSDAEVRSFGRAVGRRFGRFAFPDAVAVSLKPLQDLILDKAGREQSPEGRALADVVEIRVECPTGWRAGPYSLVVAFVVRPGTLPLFEDDELPEIDPALAPWLSGGGSPGSSAVAERLGRSIAPADRYFLWQALASAWADKCDVSVGTPDGDQEVVTEVVGEVLDTDEYSLSRYRSSERLDVDHLSVPPTAS